MERLRHGESLGLALVHAEVPEPTRRLLLGHFVTEELADGLDRHYEYDAKGLYEYAFEAELAVDDVLEAMASVRRRAQKIGALALLPFIALLIVHGVNDKVPLFLASFAGFAAALPGIMRLPRMRRLALDEARLEYAEYYFLFPLFLSITLLTSAGFFDVMQTLVVRGIATLGHGHVAFAQFLGSTFLSAILDNNIVADFASRGLHGLDVNRPEVLRDGADRRLRARRLLDAHRLRAVGRRLRVHPARRRRALHARSVDQGDDAGDSPDDGDHGRDHLCPGRAPQISLNRAYHRSVHADPIAPLILSLALILVAAKIGGHLAAKTGQPHVLGELGVGVLLGNLSLTGYSGLDHLRTDASLDMLARLGVIVLMFQIGLESTVRQMMKVGLSSLLVATFGVLGPFALGWGVGIWLLPDAGMYAHIFLGAALTATSVGISARVLQDLGKSQTTEARIILGASVIDDVQGLIVLAAVIGAVEAANVGGSLSNTAVVWLVVKASVFLFGSLALGVYLSPKLFTLASRLDASGVLLAVGLAYCFTLAWLADRAGLAPIVGAFAAGLILEDPDYKMFVARGEHPLGHLIEPVASFLVPIFFVVMGARTDLRVFADSRVLVLAAALTAAAVAGKQMCALGVVGRGLDRLSVGIGMIPRGEVGLIFANIGLTLVVGGQPVITQGIFSALVVMVMVTTVMTPPALKWSFKRLSTARRRS